VTRPESLVGVARCTAKALWSTILVSDALRFVAPSLPPATLIQAPDPLPLLICVIDDAHSALLS